MSENKNLFFSVNLILSSKTKPKKEHIVDKLNLVLASMSVIDRLQKFSLKKKDELPVLFQTESRKRRGQLIKYCNTILKDEYSYQVINYIKLDFETQFNKFKVNQYYELKEESNLFNHYKQTNRKVFDDYKNWYPWQTIYMKSYLFLKLTRVQINLKYRILEK